MDRTTEMLSAYACGLTYEELGPTVVEQVKRTLVDTMGCAVGGYDSEPAAIARSLADGVQSGPMPSRVLGSGNLRTTPDLAAFANGVAVRYLDCNDSYFSPGRRPPQRHDSRRAGDGRPAEKRRADGNHRHGPGLRSLLPPVR